MVQATAVLGTISLAFGILLALTGRATYEHTTPRADYLPALAYSLWWVSTGFFFGLSGTIMLIDTFWRPDFALHLTETHVNLVVGSFALFFLSYYFSYLFLGPTKIWVFLAGFYSLSALVLIYLVNQQRPAGLENVGGQYLLVYENELPAFGTVRRMIALLFVPPTLGLVGYLSLLKRAPSKVQRLRILLVSLLFIVVTILTISSRILLVAEPFVLDLILLTIGSIAVSALLLTYPDITRRKIEAWEARAA